MKKWLMLLLCASPLTDQAQTTPAAPFKYGEALQKSFFFYEAQQSGAIPAWNRVSWRGNSGMTDGADKGVDLTGGWYDAGDHVKFGLPMAFSATALAWGGIQFQSGYNKSGQMVHLKNNLRFVADYFIKCHPADNTFYGQVGDGDADHAWWGSAEVMPMARPSYKLGANDGPEILGETAAALAAISILFKISDPTYSAKLLLHAKQLYAMAEVREAKYTASIPAGSFYNSWSGGNDEKIWGAAWLYKATNDPIYLQKAETFFGKVEDERGLPGVKPYVWTIAWDDKIYGSYVLLSQLTNNPNYKVHAERWLDYWTSGNDLNRRIKYTPGGLAHLDQWGSLRYASNTAFCALAYSDLITDPVKKKRYKDFGIRQINYALGDNPNNRSYVCGFGVNPPTKPHHRTAHGAWGNNVLDRPIENRHILYGALVGGPSASDTYTDSRGDYISNEVATDYNAMFTGALARLYDEFGGEPLANFPVLETPTDEFYADAKFNAVGSNFTEYAVYFTNHSAWPSKSVTNASFRLFFDLSEGLNNGLTLADYSVTKNSSASAVVSPLQVWDAAKKIYYTEVSMPGIKIFPGGDEAMRKEAQVRLTVNSSNPIHWNAANDPAALGLGNNLVKTANIPVYDNGVLLFGKTPTKIDTPNRIPTAKFVATPKQGNSPLSVIFDGSTSIDPDDDILTYSWNFGDGTTATGKIANKTYSAVGTFIATLTVNDGRGGLNTVSDSIRVLPKPNTAPLAVISANKTTGLAPLVVNFDASASSDLDGDALTYLWNFGDGTTNSTAKIVSHTFAAIGNYTVTLTVKDGKGGTDVKTILIAVKAVVVNTPPVANFTPSTDVVGDEPLALTFNGSTSTDLESPVLTYAWDFGDGTTATGVSANKTFAKGVYTVKLTVTDGDGATSVKTIKVTAKEKIVVFSPLKVQYRTYDASINDNAFKPQFNIINTGTASVPLSELKIRYYFTKENSEALNFWCDYAQIGSGNITSSFVSGATAAQNYLEIGFGTGAGSLAAGAQTGEIQNRISTINWQNFNESNDYSFDGTKTNFVDWSKVTLYRNGTLIWGTPPASGAKVGVAEKVEKPEVKVKLFPNPTSKVVNVTITAVEKDQFSLKLSNNTGVNVAATSVGLNAGETKTVALAVPESITSGMYFLNTSGSKSKLITKKVFIKK